MDMDTAKTKKLTRKEAISRLVELDVARWGEAHRADTIKMHSSKSRAEAMYAIAYHVSIDDADGSLEAAAKAATTATDVDRARANNDIEFDDLA